MAGRPTRPLAALAAAGTVAHHGFELGAGVGLVFQPELGLAGSATFWGVGLAAWTAAAAGGGRRTAPLLDAACGAALAGSLVHFTLWPWRLSRAGVPVLTEAEGLPAGSLPAYNAILWGWAAAAALSVVLESGRGGRRWALLGVATLPALRWSARHHFDWLHREAVASPAWWNRAAAPPPVAGPDPALS